MHGERSAAVVLAVIFLSIGIGFALTDAAFPMREHVEGWIVKDAYVQAAGCNRTTMLFDLGGHQEYRFYEGNWTGHRNQYVWIEASKERQGPCRGFWNVTAFSTNAA